MNCPREDATSFELGLDSKIEFFVVGSDSSIIHVTRSKSVMGEDAGLNTLEVATYHTSVRG